MTAEDTANPESGAEQGFEAAARVISGLLDTPPEEEPKGQPEGQESETGNEPQPQAEAQAEPESEPGPDQETEGEEEAPDVELEPEPEPEPTLYTVKVNGEERKVSLDDLKSGYMMETDYRQKTAAVAERNKVFDDLSQRVQSLDTLIAGLEGTGPFQDIKTPDDVRRLAEEDPLTFTQYQAHRIALDDARMARAEAQQDLAQENQHRYHEWLASEQKRIVTLIPEMADPVKGTETKQAIATYAVGLGFAPERLAAAGADEINILNKARLWDELQKAKPRAKKKVVNAPPVQKPGAPRQTDQKADALKAAEDRLRKQGGFRNAAAVIGQRYG